MRQPRLSSPASQRGIGALVVVMSLFFIMSMVAAYASRNLIFEQKTSANNYRSTQAFEAAETGLEWAIAMLNDGRVDDLCVGTTNVARDTFRDRHLSVDANGFVSTRKWLNAGVETDLQPSCVLGAAGWDCSCRSNAAPVLAEPAGVAPKPTFRITFQTVAGQPGLVRVFSQGCSSFGTQCFAGAGQRADAVAEVNALVGLAPSLTQTPAAALTVRGDLVALDAKVSNDQGVVINAGGAVDPNPLNVQGPAGSPALVSDRDPSLTGPYYSGTANAGGLTPGQVMFLSAFGAPPVAFRVQPAVVRMPCANACAPSLQDAAAQYPGRVIWIDGDFVIDDGAVVAIGSVASPVVVIVSGNMTFGIGSNVTINGLVYSRGARWDATGSNVLVNGAFVAEGVESLDPTVDGSFTITGAPSIVFDADVLDRLKKAQERHVMDFGSIVRVPGSWRDFR